MSLNKIMLIGNVGNDPEVRYIDTGVCTAQFSLATTTRGYTLQNGTQVPERTEWHQICVWRSLAQYVEKYVRKGDKLFVEGELRYRSYTDKKGLTHKTTEIWCTNLEYLQRASSQSTATNIRQSEKTESTVQSHATTAAQSPTNPFPSSGSDTTNQISDNAPSDKCPF